MIRLDLHQNLKFKQEEANVRAYLKDCAFLFKNVSLEQITDWFNTYVEKAETIFLPRWDSLPVEKPDDALLISILQLSTLDWMYYFVAVGDEVRIRGIDWKHPQIYRIVQREVNKYFPPESDAAFTVCAHLLKISKEDFIRWNENDDIVSNR